MMSNGVVVSVLMLAFSAMLVKKLDAMSLQPLACPENMEKGCSPCSDRTCESLKSYIQLTCTEEKQCSQTCVCKKDHYLQNNKCVHVDHCQVECPKNMVFNPCVKKTITCIGGLVAEYAECKHRCQCAEGYIFSGVKAQECIKISDCPNKPNYS